MATKSLTRWRCGEVAVLLLGALLVPLVMAEDAQSAPEEDKATRIALQIAVQKAREVAARLQGQKNLHNIVLAMHMHADAMGGRFPSQATYDKNGKPMLSWRVLILPYLEKQDLYKQFHFNEPWDSEHNKKLLAKMPKLYASPQDEKTFKEHTTHYQGFVGKGAFFEGKQGLHIQNDITDGLGFTIMIAEAPKAVPWTKPEDIPYDDAKPVPKLGLRGDRNFSSAMADGAVRFNTPALTEKTLRLMITRNDGLPLGPDF